MNLFGKVLSLLLVFCISVSTLPVDAATSNYDHKALMEYEGYGEAMYEGVVRETTFLAGQYTDNKDYVSKSIDQVVDYMNGIMDEVHDTTTNCGSAMDCLRGIFEMNAGQALTVADWVKNLFNDYTEETQNSGPVINDIYYFDGGNGYYLLNGYKFKSSASYVNDNTKLFPDVWKYDSSYLTLIVDLNSSNNRYTFDYSTAEQSQNKMNELRSIVSSGNLVNVITALNALNGISISIVNGVGVDFPIHGNADPELSTINNYIQNASDEKIVTPQPKPYLVCPNGSVIDLTVSGSTFSAGSTTQLVNKDGTSSVGGTVCNLNWKVPEVKYVNDKAVIETPQGDFVPVETTGGNDVEIIDPSDKDIKPIDKSLLAYVRNSYEYATGAIDIAVGGLKSLNEGSEGLVQVYGTFMGWLPKEIQAMFIGGLGLMIGLRIFRK